MDIKQEQARFRQQAQVSSNCLPCKAVTECSAGGKSFPGCILCRKPGACSGPYRTWEGFEREAEKED